MKNKKAFIFIILAGLFWGMSAIFVNLLSVYGFTPVQLTAVRATVAFALIGAFVAVKNRSAFSITLKRLPLFISLGVTLFFSAFLYYSSMVRTSVCTAVILLNLHPIYVTTFSAIFYRERLSKVKLSSIAAMLLGCAFVSGIFGGLELDPLGLVLGILSGVSYASYILLVKYYNQEGIPSSTANVYSFLFMAAVALSVSDPVNIVEITAAKPMPILPLLFGIGICTSVIPFVLNGIALRDLSAGTVSALSIVEPLSATVYSVVFFGEPMDAWKIVGVVLILGAVVFLGLDEIWSERALKKVSAESSEKKKYEFSS